MRFLKKSEFILRFIYDLKLKIHIKRLTFSKIFNFWKLKINTNCYSLLKQVGFCLRTVFECLILISLVNQIKLNSKDVFILKLFQITYPSLINIFAIKFSK